MDENNKPANLSNQFAGSSYDDRPKIYSNMIDIMTVVFLAFTAIATSYGTYLQRKQRIENSPIINVQCADEGYKLGQNSKLNISASNSGNLPVTLSSIGIEIPEGNKYSGEYLFPDTEKYGLPFKLEPGARPSAYGYNKYINETELSKILKSNGISEDVEAFFFLKDGPGRKFKCEKPINLSSNSFEDLKKI